MGALQRGAGALPCLAADVRAAGVLGAEGEASIAVHERVGVTETIRKGGCCTVGKGAGHLILRFRAYCVW